MQVSISVQCRKLSFKVVEVVAVVVGGAGGLPSLMTTHTSHTLHKCQSCHSYLIGFGVEHSYALVYISLKSWETSSPLTL